MEGPWPMGDDSLTIGTILSKANQPWLIPDDAPVIIDRCSLRRLRSPLILNLLLFPALNSKIVIISIPHYYYQFEER